jgi:hypothetical protein
LLPRLSFAQTNATAFNSNPPPPAPKSAATPKLAHSAATATELQKAVDQLTQSNRDLLDLLKQQQAVLEDMQFDRRLQSRQIQSLEERLEDSLYQNTQLQNQIAKLESEASVHPPDTAATAPPVSTGSTNSSPTQIEPPPVADTPPPPPSTYLPPPDTVTPAGTPSWHRLLTLKGDSNQQSDLFRIQGGTWRVLWHNQDKPGKEYANTSALFISAFPRDDTIPQKVCAKLGTGGDSSELLGPGNYYLKIEASGGSWELAVEDFR